MNRGIKLSGLFFIFMLFFASLSFSDERTFTISTYYPSPYGSYMELTAQKMKIGMNYSKPGYSISNNNLIVEGMVGIGAYDQNYGPDDKLVVRGDIRTNGSTVLKLENISDGTSTDVLSFMLSNGVYTNGHPSAIVAGQILAGKEGSYNPANNQNSFLAFSTARSGVNTEAMRITSAGRVGMGGYAYDPTENLVIRDVVNASNVLQLENLSGKGINDIDALRFMLSDGAWTNGHPGIFPAGQILAGKEGDYGGAADRDSFLAFFTASNGVNAERLRITSDGKVGIGTVNPSVALDVHGEIECDPQPAFGVFTQAYLVQTASPHGGVYRLALPSSSRKYKERITDLKHGLDLVEKLRPVEFSWKNTDIRDFGFIAEEAAKISPLLVTHLNEVDTFKYMQLGAILVNAIKELKAENDALNEKNNDLENRVRKLELKIKSNNLSDQ